MRHLILAAGLSLVLAAPVAAQDAPKFDISGGYSFLRDSEIDESFHGWVASVAGNVNPWLGVVGEIGGNYKSIPFEGDGDGGVDLSLHSFMGGVRLSSRVAPRVTPFAQVLLGAVRGNAKTRALSLTETDFALQPGGGVDIWIGTNAGLRVGADLRRIFAGDDDIDDEDGGINEFRFYVGIVIAGGR